MALRTNSDHYPVRYNSELQRVVVTEIPFATSSHNIDMHTMILRIHQNFPFTDDCKSDVNTRRSLGVDSNILNLVNRWRKMVNFSSLAFTSAGSTHSCHCIWCWVGLGAVEKPLQWLRGYEPRLDGSETTSAHTDWHTFQTYPVWVFDKDRHSFSCCECLPFSSSKKMPVTNASSYIPLHSEFKLDCHISLEVT